MNRALKAPLVPKAIRETQEPPGQQALQGHKALTVRRETKVTRAIPELLVPRVPPVQLVLRELKGLRVFKALPVR